MPMTLLQLVQAAADRLAQPRPVGVIGVADATTRQWLGLANEYLDDLVTRKLWERNQRQVLHTALPTVDQGSIDDICPEGFSGIMAASMFNRTTQLPVDGSLTSSEWQVRQTLRLTGPLPQFRVQNNRFLLYPAPTAGHIYAWEYYSSWFVQSADGTTRRQYWLADTDTNTISDPAAIAWLKAAWKRDKGFDYAEDMAAYERLIAIRGQRDDAPADLDMSGGPMQRLPGVIVPIGSWNV